MRRFRISFEMPVREPDALRRRSKADCWCQPERSTTRRYVFDLSVVVLEGAYTGLFGQPTVRIAESYPTDA